MRRLKLPVEGVPRWVAYRTFRDGRPVIVMNWWRGRLWLRWLDLTGRPAPGDREARHAVA